MTTRHTVSDVVQQFRSLNRRGERIAVMDGYGKEFRNKRYSIFHKKGGANNHFQGVQRLGNHLLVTGSYPYRSKRSDLFVVRLGSRAADPGPWGSNMMRDRDPPSTDRLVNYFRLDPDYWHPGGFSLLDSLAVVPVHNSQGQSKIVFVDLQNPEEPKRLNAQDIDRPNYKVGACAITPLQNDRLLLAVWSDSDEPPGGGPAPYHLDIYQSDAPNSTASFTMVAQLFPPEDHDFHRSFQCLDFVWEQQDGGSETLYVMAFENTSGMQPNPLNPGENKAYLFKVALGALPATAPQSGPARLPEDFVTLQESCLFETSGNWCNMDAGACVYVDSNQQLIVYSVYHFLAPIRGAATTGDLVMKCLEFRATEFASPITRIEDAWVDLYEDPGLQGRRLALAGPWDSSIENTERIYADDKQFNVAASIRYQLPDDRAFLLYPGKEYRGAGALVLTGTGDIKEVDVFATGFGGEFGSCRLQPESVALELPGAIIA